jgi:chromosome segregation and condensation protein ScpB
VEPVGRDVLARVIGSACSLELLIDDIREELRGRPYELVAVAAEVGTWIAGARIFPVAPRLGENSRRSLADKY